MALSPTAEAEAKARAAEIELLTMLELEEAGAADSGATGSKGKTKGKKGSVTALIASSQMQRRRSILSFEEAGLLSVAIGSRSTLVRCAKEAVCVCLLY